MHSARGTVASRRGPRLKEDRIILHFDYDCFYAAVFEAQNPVLRGLPLAVQQKQIIVTCNYEARRRGLYKLQLVTEARAKCPNVIIVLGENLDPFRQASKELSLCLSSFIWSKKSERLGFDELWLDVTDMVDYNLELLNENALSNSFFHLHKSDPTIGFPYDASVISGCAYPQSISGDPAAYPYSALDTNLGPSGVLQLRLLLASHLASFLRHKLEETKGYTATVGISVNKLLSKLVGNVNKPKAQTTLLPPYNAESDEIESNVTKFLDGHDIGKIPGIGFKLSRTIREFFLGREPRMMDGLVFGPTTSKEKITVRDIRLHKEMSSRKMEDILSGPGAPKGIGAKVWDLLHGIDDTEVARAKTVPTQISIEDSYLRLNTLQELRQQLLKLSSRLIKRLQLDLTDDSEESGGGNTHLRWIAQPQTLRLSTRPRPPMNPDGSRSRSFNRISRSERMPSFVFGNQDIEALATRLVEEALLPMFWKLHPEKDGWDLSLVNLAAVNMQESAGNGAAAHGRDIGEMFKGSNTNSNNTSNKLSTSNSGFLNGATAAREKVSKQTPCASNDPAPTVLNGSHIHPKDHSSRLSQSVDKIVSGTGLTPPMVTPISSPLPPGSEDPVWQRSNDYNHYNDDGDSSYYDDEAADAEEGFSALQGYPCEECGAVIPTFAEEAHARFHIDPG